MTLALVSIASLALGIVIGRATALLKIGEREPDGFAGGDDWSFAGKPLLYIDGEVTDLETAIRRAEGAAQ